MQYRRLLAVIAAASFSPLLAGSPVCAACHPKEAALYAKSSMGRSLTTPQPMPVGSVRDERANAVITIEQHGGQMVHSLEEQGQKAEFAVKYQVGAGFIGRTYAVQMGDYFFESPVSWFKRYGWDLSPGYAPLPAVDFDRALDEKCLTCHASGVRFADADRHRLQSADLQAITCDRCHGPTESHLQHPSRSNIVNPARLTGAERNSVCEQCHLEGATRILNPGKQWEDFRAGERTEDVYSTYILKGGASKDVLAVSQAELLAESMCVRSSAGKLWCGSCHNPHAETSDRQNEIRNVCLGCHATNQLSTPAHTPALRECTSCHMPTAPTTNIPHAALTDHRLRKRPEIADSDSGPLRVAVWRAPEPPFETRNLALAEVFVGISKRDQTIGEDGLRLLEELPSDRVNNDPAVLSDMEGLAMEAQDLPTALQMGRRSVELQPNSAKAAMNYGLVLKRSGDLAGAERELDRATRLDPALKQAFLELTMLYAAEQKPGDAIATVDRYLKFNPQDILFRLERARLTAKR